MKILLVDDSEIDLMINTKIIEMTYHNSQVSSFDNVDTFFNYVQENDQPDAVITDMQMPRTTGLELAGKFINQFGDQNTKMVLLTAFVDDRIRKEVEAVSPAIKLIEKPLNKGILKDLLSA